MANKIPVRVLLNEFGKATGLAEFQAGDQIDPQFLPAPAATTTDSLPEGTTNLYFTIPRVLAATLTGFASSTGAVGAGDSILIAIGKLQGTKVDKVAGLQLSQESYTTLEKNKLAGLDPNHFRGVFATLAALQAAVPTANTGDYAFVDPASGTDVIQYLWDNNDSKWVYNGPTAGVTAAQVKTLYESNADTNAFTNAYKTKVDGIAAGAQVNTVTSVAGKTGAVTLAKGDVGLDQVDNTPDASKPVSTPQQTALNLKVSLSGTEVVTGTKTFSATLTTFSGSSVIMSPAVGGNMGLEIGYTGNATSTPFIDWHSSGFPTDYDARLIANGGNGSPGNGSLSFQGAAFYMQSDLYVNRGAQECQLILNSNAGQNRYVRFNTAGSQRWQFGVNSAAESGSSAGSGFYINRFDDSGVVLGNTLTVDRASGDIALWGKVQTTGPFKPGSYTTTTLPSAALFNGYMILVTNAAGGAKYCVSNGTVWQLINTATTVS